jgi:RNA polymerase sigma factor (sigma-70 family)
MSKQEIEQKALHDFDDFVTQLKAQKQQEWQWLMAHFEELVIPWVFKKISLPADYTMSKAAFVEEVFANTTYKFFDIFKTGEFGSLADLRGLMFKIAALKIKEGYQKVKRDQRIYFSDELTTIEESNFELSVGERRRKEALTEVKEHIYNLPQDEQQILLEYLKGESFKEISETTGLSEANCRKKKQRALTKVKKMFFDAIKVLVLFLMQV